MVDPDCKGHRFTPVVAHVEAARLQEYLRAIGETNPAVAGPEGSEPAVIPPVYLFCLEMLDAEDPFRFVNEIGIRADEILHADQSFRYHHPIRIGDTLTFQARVSDLFDKKNGALTFVTQDVDVLDQNERLVAEISRTFVVRNVSETA